MRQCIVPGCSRAANANGWRIMCNSHASRQRRHGDARQPTIHAHELEPYIRRVRKWIARQNNSEQLQRTLTSAFDAMLDAALADVREEQSRKTRTIYTRTASEIAKIAADADKEKALLTVIAMACFREAEPRRFVSDRGFRFQLARRWRGLSDIHVASYWQHATGQQRRVYRDAPPFIADALGQRLMEALGGFGLAINSKIETERMKANEALMAAHSAIGEAREGQEAA